MQLRPAWRKPHFPNLEVVRCATHVPVMLTSLHRQSVRPKVEAYREVHAREGH